MKKQWRYSCFPVVVIGVTLMASGAFAQSVDTARIESAGQNDWLTYHGSYKSYHYSPLAQINPSNVSNLGVAWIHIPGRSTRGLQSMPLAADGGTLLHWVLQPHVCTERRYR
ncbi:glucose dehydrogenase [Bradyrhizobium sp. F1.13.1]